MKDSEIVELYWQRDERAIGESDHKYGSYCFAIAENILSNASDAEESVNDTWLKAWEAMPPHRPGILSSFLGKICRNLAISRLRLRMAQKRGGGDICLAMEELSGCIPSRCRVEEELDARELAAAINAFLRTLKKEERDVFMARYWYGAPVSLICERSGSKSARIKSMLLRTRRKLAEYLEKEGFLWKA